jgi:hypothetical protein
MPLNQAHVSMPFICPNCGALSLEIVHTIELAGDARSDEISLQQVGCIACGLRGAAFYQESRRGRLDEETWEHAGLVLENEDNRRLAELLGSCPDPTNPACGCPAHRLFGQVSADGNWNGLDRFKPLQSFKMILR